jgi:hypothetical protein
MRDYVLCVSEASQTKRSLEQVQAVLDRLHEELSGVKVVRISFYQYLNDWSKAEDQEATLEFMNADPALLADLMTAELHPFSVALARKNSE